MTPERRVGRRQLLRGGAAVTGGVVVGAAGATAAGAVSRDSDAESAALTGAESVAFHGAHQAGIDTEPQAHLALLGLDLRPDVDREALGRLMRLLSDDAERLAGGRAPLADTEPELAVLPSRLTTTFGWGPRVFADIVGPQTGGVQPLPGFSTDRLEEGWGQTDLVIQVCGDDPIALAHAVKVLLRDARAFTLVRWVQDGFRRARGAEADGTTMRNLMGQVDGTVNPAPGSADFEDLVWLHDGPLAGGTQLVVRRVEMNIDTWEKVDRVGREFTIGRTLANGAPLTGKRERDDPDFAATDAVGFPVIDPAAHIRRARSEDPAERIFRRSYNYDGVAGNRWDAGLVFLSFQADAARQFTPIQRRLAEQDRLNQWVTTIGSAIYTILPGCAKGGYVGETLLE